MKKTVVVCDRCGDVVGDGGGVSVAIGRRRLRADLCSSHVGELLAALGRPEKPKPRRRRGKAEDSATVRAWAAENGYEVSAKGRIPAAVLEAYRAG